MRGLRMMVVAIACAGSMAVAHGQAGGDEPGGKPETTAPAPVSKTHIPRISSGVMAQFLKTKVDPAYPSGAHGDAMVVLHAIIGKDGHVKTLDPVQGPEVFRAAAIEAVKQWTYKVYLLNGEPSEVDTNIIINFHSSN